MADPLAPPARAVNDGQNGERPRPRHLAAALTLLTALPGVRPQRSSEGFARAVLFFPLVGLLLGGLLAVVRWRLGTWLPAWLSGTLVVFLWEGADRGARLRAYAGRRQGLPGLLGATTIVLLKIAAVSAIGVARPAALLFAPLLGRWAMVVLATGARDVAAPGRKFNAGINFREFALTSVFTFAVVFAIAEAVGILVVLCAAALTLGLRLLSHRRGGGISWSFLLASAEAIETVVVVLLALM